MSFLAVIATTPEGRVAKFQEFSRRADADAHVAAHGGFVVNRSPTISIPSMKIDPVTKAVTREVPPPPVVREHGHIQAIRILANLLGPAEKAQVLALLDD